MKEYAYYYDMGSVCYVILTPAKSLDIGGQQVYVSGRDEAIFQAEHRRATRVNF